MIFRSFSAPRKVAIRENNDYYKDPYTLLLEDCINNNLSYSYFQESIGRMFDNYNLEIKVFNENKEITFENLPDLVYNDQTQHFDEYARNKVIDKLNHFLKNNKEAVDHALYAIANSKRGTIPTKRIARSATEKYIDRNIIEHAKKHNATDDTDIFFASYGHKIKEAIDKFIDNMITDDLAHDLVMDGVNLSNEQQDAAEQARKRNQLIIPYISNINQFPTALYRIFLNHQENALHEKLVEIATANITNKNVSHMQIDNAVHKMLHGDEHKNLMDQILNLASDPTLSEDRANATVNHVAKMIATDLNNNTKFSMFGLNLNAFDDTTSAPKRDDTTSAPKRDDTTSAPKRDDTTSAPKRDDTTSAPKRDDTTSAPKRDDTTSAPKRDDTTSAPKRDDTTSAPKRDDTTSANATQSGGSNNNETDKIKDMYDKLQYKGMAWPREKLAKILKWAHQKAYEYNKKIHDKGDKAAWYQKAFQFLTRIIEFCTRKLHNFVSDDKNQITWEYDKKNDDKNTANSSTTTTASASTPPATPKQESTLMRYNRYKSIIREHFDMTDIPTVRHIMALNEEEQNTLLISLTNRLYQLIVNKIDSVDFGEIPSTQGNVRRLSRYKQMRECIEVLHKIFVQYKENPEPVQVIDNALSNLENYSELFMASYAKDIQFGQMVYETTTLGVIEAIGFMIAVCIEYVKEPKKQGLQVTLRKAGVMKVKNHLLYENLVKFNDACKRGDLERAIRPLIRNNVKDFSLVTGALVAIHIVAALYVICAAILPFLRQMSYFFYATRVRISTYFDAQADLLEMNAKELKSNSHINTEDDKNKVIARQLKIAELFHATADKIAIDSRGAEIEATKTMKAEDKKYKMDEVNSNPAMVDTGGPLF